ncbi:hypothetical protein QTH97_27895 [Variovorax sp. J22R24]|uniref:hypothetical protein n=1 Tax=Variovorax gracilis TaxID=3053502 RepID=UPI002575B4A1|nr:hypothetical protein [Variovorax sp. J22R24]MDM0108795.1 hypothetical protein [Variovorax sp. J22R24]
MQGLVFNGPGKKNVEDRPKPTLQMSTDAVIRLTRATVCGTEVHLLCEDIAAPGGSVSSVGDSPSCI